MNITYIKTYAGEDPETCQPWYYHVAKIKLTEEDVHILTSSTRFDSYIPPQTDPLRKWCIETFGEEASWGDESYDPDVPSWKAMVWNFFFSHEYMLDLFVLKWNNVAI